jgi:death-on-curing protein
MVEQHFTETVAEFFQDYEDPVPGYQYLGGEYGRGQLESALAQQWLTWNCRYVHRSIYDKAAALWRSLTLDHPFIDGNKRMGFLCCWMFLGFNGYYIIAPQDEIEEKCVLIAAGNPAPPVAGLASWLRKNTIPIDKAIRFLSTMAALPEYWKLGVEVVSDLTGRTDYPSPA